MQAGVRGIISTLTMPTPVFKWCLGKLLRLYSLLVLGTNTVCAINTRNKKPISIHHCYRNCAGSLCSMEANIILEGFWLSEEIHGLWYLWLIGDGNSSVYHSVVTSVPLYGRKITKVECANHAVKCYRNRLKALCNDKPEYRGKHGLSQAMMKQILHGAQCAITTYSTTGDVAALHHDLQNGPQHCFGFHDSCNSAFCQHKSNPSSGDVKITMWFHYKLLLLYTEPSPLDKLPPNFLHDVEGTGDRLVAKQFN